MSGPTEFDAAGAAAARLARLAQHVNRVLAAAAAVALIGLMLFVVIEVAARAFGWPLTGAVEIIGWLAAVAMALALAHVQLQRGHVAMTVLTDRLSGRPRALLDAAVAALALLLFAAVTFYLARYALTLRETGSLSETLKVIVFPWVFVVALGFAGLCLALLLDLLRCLIALLRPR